MTNNMIVIGTHGTEINSFADCEIEVAFLYFNGSNIAVTDDPVIGRRKPFWMAPCYEANYRSIYSCDNNAATVLLESAIENAFNQLGINVPDKDVLISTFAEHVLSK